MRFKQLVRRKRFVVPLIASTALALGAGIAFASHGGGGHVYYACLTNGGALNNVTEDGPAPECNGNSALINWNQEGQPGADGADGEDGADGSLGFYQVSASTTVPPETSRFASATCDSGDVVTGGGYRGLGLSAWDNYPDSDSTWIVLAHNPNPFLGQTLAAWAVCADFPPAHVP